MKYWQKKLENNPTVQFSDSLADELVAETAGFSFAYLKEVLYGFRLSSAYTQLTAFTCQHILPGAPSKPQARNYLLVWRRSEGSDQGPPGTDGESQGASGEPAAYHRTD